MFDGVCACICVCMCMFMCVLREQPLLHISPLSHPWLYSSPCRGSPTPRQSLEDNRSQKSPPCKQKLRPSISSQSEKWGNDHLHLFRAKQRRRWAELRPVFILYTLSVSLWCCCSAHKYTVLTPSSSRHLCLPSSKHASESYKHMLKQTLSSRVLWYKMPCGV